MTTFIVFATWRSAHEAAIIRHLVLVVVNATVKLIESVHHKQIHRLRQVTEMFGKNHHQRAISNCRKKDQRFVHATKKRYIEMTVSYELIIIKLLIIKEYNPVHIYFISYVKYN